MEKKKMLVLKISIPIILGIICFGVIWGFNVNALDEKEKTVVVCEDESDLNINDDKYLQIVKRQKMEFIEGLHNIYGFTGGNKVIVGIGVNKKEFETKYKKDFYEMNDEEIDKAEEDIYGKIYSLDLETQKRIPLKNKDYDIKAVDVSAGISPDGTMLEYTYNDKQYIYNINTNESTEYFNEPQLGRWSQDGNYIINYESFGGSGDRHTLRLYDVKNNTTKEVKVDENIAYITSIPGFDCVDGKEIYFIGEQVEEKSYARRQGILKINVDTGKIEPVMMLPYVDRSKKHYKENCLLSNNYSLIDGYKKIIFEGKLNDETGIYIYDIESDTFNKVVSTTKKGCGVSFYISPDKSKIIYATVADKKDGKRLFDLYAAKIQGNKLVNRISLVKGIDLGGSMDESVHWSSDSKKVIYFEENDEYTKNHFQISDKNIINIVSFK